MVSKALVRKDMKMLFRDPIMFLILLIPFILTGVVRLVIHFDPFSYLPFETDRELIIKLMRRILPLFGGMMGGWVTGFLLLEEKESGLEPQLNVTPLAPSDRLFTRLVLTLAIGVLMNLLIWIGDRLLYGPEDEVLAAYLLSGLIGPFIMMILDRWGKNRVQGLTLAKLSSLILIPPILQFVFPDIPRILWIFLSPASVFMGDRALLFPAGVVLLMVYTGGIRKSGSSFGTPRGTGP